MVANTRDGPGLGPRWQLGDAVRSYPQRREPDRVGLGRIEGQRFDPSDGRPNVTELCERTGLAYNLVSHHLQCPNDCTLVDAEQRGRKRFYRIGRAAGPQMIVLADECIERDVDSVLGCEIVDDAGEATPSDDP